MKLGAVIIFHFSVVYNKYIDVQRIRGVKFRYDGAGGVERDPKVIPRITSRVYLSLLHRKKKKNEKKRKETKRERWEGVISLTEEIRDLSGPRVTNAVTAAEISAAALAGFAPDARQHTKSWRKNLACPGGSH